MEAKQLVFALSILIACNSCIRKEEKLSPDEAREIARKAYVYAFPMVVNYKTMYMYSINEDSPEYKGAFNEMSCEARLYTPEDKAVVTPNSDTPYCMFWVDLRKEPQIISFPEIETGRYFSFQLIDLYTHNFAYLGSLTTGNKAGDYLIATDDWDGEVPGGIKDVIRCETDLFFVVVRTQLMHADDMENVAGIQESYALQGLGSYSGNEPSIDPAADDFPAWKEGEQFTAGAFHYLDRMLEFANPPESEGEMLERFARLGIGTDKGFDLQRFDEATQKAIEEGVEAGMKDIEAFIAEYSRDPLLSAKIFGTREFLTESAQSYFQLEDFYVLRAVAAHTGLYGNSGAEAMYPAYLMEAPGLPYDGSKNCYTLTFEKDQLPPVKAFWSLSMYDGPTQLFIHNELDRYLLNSNDMDKFLFNDDGSLTLYIQKDSPGKDLESNWLPAPDGPFYCVMRLYGPEEEALSGKWSNPPMVKSTIK